MKQKVLSILALLMVSVVSTMHLHAASLGWRINAVYQSDNSSATASGYAAYMFVTANTTDVTVSNVTTLSDVTTLINQGNISEAIALATVSGSVSDGRISETTDISFNFSTGTLTAFAIIFDAADAASAEHYFLVNGGNTSSVTFTSGTGLKTISFGNQNSGETSSTIAANWRSMRAPATKYDLTLADGTEDAANWTIDPASADAGEQVTLKYNGLMKVESITAVKKEAVAVARTLAEATAADLGKIAGADGNIYETKDAAEAAGTTAVAMIAYVGSETDHATYKHGLAIGLDIENLNGEYSLQWDAAKSACEGKTAVPGAAWLLPSVNQWKAMLKAFGNNESNISGLNTALSNAGAVIVSYTAFTSVDSGDRTVIMEVSGENISFEDAFKDHEYYNRSCLAF